MPKANALRLHVIRLLGYESDKRQQLTRDTVGYAIRCSESCASNVAPEQRTRERPLKDTLTDFGQRGSDPVTARQGANTTRMRAPRDSAGHSTWGG